MAKELFDIALFQSDTLVGNTLRSFDSFWQVRAVLGQRCPLCEQIVRKQYADAKARAKAWRAKKRTAGDILKEKEGN